jgi:hypothetical protein
MENTEAVIHEDLPVSSYTDITSQKNDIGDMGIITNVLSDLCQCDQCIDAWSPQAIDFFSSNDNRSVNAVLELHTDMPYSLAKYTVRELREAREVRQVQYRLKCSD